MAEKEQNGNGNDTARPTNRKGNETWVLFGIIGAIVLGTLIGGLAPKFATQFDILGDIFLRLLKMIIVPLVMLSLIVGVTSLGDIRNLGSVGRRTIFYYLGTTGVSVVIGLALVNLIQPGVGIQRGENHPQMKYTIQESSPRTLQLSQALKRTQLNEYKGKYVVYLEDQKVLGQIHSVSRRKITVKFWKKKDQKGVIYLQATDGTKFPFRRIEGELISAEPQLKSKGKGFRIDLGMADKVRGKENKGVLNVLEEVVLGMIPRNIFQSMANTSVLSLIFFSLLLGMALSMLGAPARGALEVISSLNDAVMQIVHWIMLVAPFGIFGLVAARIGSAGGFEGFLPELIALGKYSFTVIFGLTLHAVVVLPLILWIVGRRGPLKYARGVSPALLNAFSTASSSATLPVTMEGVERNGISNRTSSFVLPLGATVNMDGTALYEAVAALFIAQVYGIELSAIQQVIIFLTATLAAIGAAGIPEAGLVTLVIVLKAVGLPIEGIGLILAIDWFIDRFRTTVNVWGDAIGAGVIETLEQSSSSPSETPEPTEA